MKYILTYETKEEQRDNHQEIVDAVCDYQTFVLGRWSERENEEQSKMNNLIEVENDITKPINRE